MMKYLIPLVALAILAFSSCAKDNSTPKEEQTEEKSQPRNPIFYL